MLHKKEKWEGLGTRLGEVSITSKSKPNVTCNTVAYATEMGDGYTVLPLIMATLFNNSGSRCRVRIEAKNYLRDRVSLY